MVGGYGRVGPGIPASRQGGIRGITPIRSLVAENANNRCLGRRASAKVPLAARSQPGTGG